MFCENKKKICERKVKRFIVFFAMVKNYFQIFEKCILVGCFNDKFCGIIFAL